MGILNTEVSRLRGIETELKTSIEDLEVQKAESVIAHNKDMEEKTLIIKGLNDDITRKKEYSLEIDGINAEKLKLEESRLIEIEKREKDVSNKEKSLEDSIGGINELSKSLVLQKNSQDDREKNLAIRANDLDALEKRLQVRDKGISASYAEADREKESARKMQAEYEKKEVTLEEDRITLTARTVSIETRESEIKIREENAKKTLEEAEIKIAEYGRKSVLLEDRESAIVRNEDDLAKRIVAYGQKETDVILRERDCRVREKSLAIREKEQQIND